MSEKQEVKRRAWWFNCVAGAFISVTVIVLALAGNFPAWAVAVGVTQLLVLAVLAWQFERFRAGPESAVVPLMVGLIPQLVLSLVFNPMSSGIGRTSGIAALALCLLAVAIVVFQKIRSTWQRDANSTGGNRAVDSSD